MLGEIKRVSHKHRRSTVDPLNYRKAEQSTAAQASRNVPLASQCAGQRKCDTPTLDVRRQRKSHGLDYVLLYACSGHVITAAIRRAGDHYCGTHQLLR